MPSSSSQPTQQDEPIETPIDASVTEAALTTSALLTRDGIAHAIIGGQALRLLGSSRRTRDVDILVEGPALEVRARLIQLDNRFSISSHMNKLVFKAGNNIFTEVELLRGGPGVTLALPSAAEAPKVVVNSASVLHPRILIITKIKRWVHIAESTRPQSILKANSDLTDIKFLLEWLVSHDQKVDFESYAPILPKDRLLPAFHTLYRLSTEVRGHLQSALEATDFQQVSSQS